ncbi:kelch-like protein 8 [Biomphalaria pfeifferi]|uniref:Kelch-like protein 8 n=1 Tax=Biomphalaria pfeifferi TaxID=112525 RepID=A0AAD8B3S2_BIOPF|nr:kelch-like protein 8 [Biomphalaria pfeifferi]
MEKKTKSVYKEDESLQTDQEVQIDGKEFKFNSKLADAIKHFIYSKKKQSEVAQKIKISSESLIIFLGSIQSYNINELWTTNNILELWDAARELENPCLLRSCERKVGEILSDENFETIYKKANLYQSHVLWKTRSFLQRSFRSPKGNMSRTRIFTYEDFSYFLNEGFLNAGSDDIVLRSIFEWAEHNETQDQNTGIHKADGEEQEQSLKRKMDVETSSQEDDPPEGTSSKLSKLLRATSCGTATLECLQELSEHHLCNKDPEAKLIISKVLNYKLDRNTHGYWPPSLFSKDYHHVAVVADQDQINVFNVYSEMWVRLPKCPLHTQITNVTVFDNELYVISSAGFESLIFVFRNNKWGFVIDLPGRNFIVISKGNLIYFIDGTSSSVKCVSPRETPVLHSEIKFPDMMRNPESAIDFDKSILIFCSTDSDERSAVFCLDVPEHKWTDVGSLKGSSKNLVGFRNETNYFSLQRDGSISQVLRKQDESIGFELIKRLWSIQSSLRGAFIYSDTLYIFSNTPIECSSLCGILGVFWNVVYWHGEQNASKFVECFLPFEALRFSEHLYTPNRLLLLLGSGSGRLLHFS